MRCTARVLLLCVLVAVLVLCACVLAYHRLRSARAAGVSVQAGAANGSESIADVIEYAGGTCTDDSKHPSGGFDADTAPREGGARTQRTRAHWTEYGTWDDMPAAARKQYAADRAAALEDLQFDWTEVNAVLLPKLHDRREYFGLINARRDGDPRRLYVEYVEAAPEVTGPRGVVFATVPPDMYDRVAARPALFTFHTHPDLPLCSALPSSRDVATAVEHGIDGKYAAHLMVSRYGIFLYTPTKAAVDSVKKSSNAELAKQHLMHDVAAAIEGIRSWRRWTLRDYAYVLQLYKMLYVVYPSPLYIAYSARKEFEPVQADPNNEALLEKLRDQIDAQRRSARKQ